MVEMKAALTETNLFQSPSDHDDSGKDDFTLSSIGISSLPEEGAKLVRAFVSIEQPALRKSIVELVSQLAKL